MYNEKTKTNKKTHGQMAAETSEQLVTRVVHYSSKFQFSKAFRS